MKKQSLKIKMTFIEPLLGLVSGNKEITSEFIASKAPNQDKMDEEVNAVPVEEQIEKGTTIFPRDDTGLFMWDYQIRGFFKESLAALIELGDADISKWQAKKVVNNFVFPGPRRIYLHKPGNGEVWKEPQGVLERSQRVETMQGERVCLARSEQLPPGTWLEFSVELLLSTNPKAKLAVFDSDLAKQCLEYSSQRGFGQFRTGGYGRYTWEEVK